MKVEFCPSCHRLILADFRYCPYCGTEMGRGPGLEESVEEPFARIERKALRLLVEERIEELAAQLDTMELELETLLEAKGGPEA